MDIPTIIILAICVGVVLWGSIILTGLFRRRDEKLEAHPDDTRLAELQEDQRLLEARIERLEEEVGFLRELRDPGTPAELRSGNAHGSEPDRDR